jgi:CIC family chloride channel protein
MKSDSPSFEEQQFTRAQHRISIRRLLNRDKTPLAILLAAAVVGTLAGWWAWRLKKRLMPYSTGEWAPWPVSPTADGWSGLGVWAVCAVCHGGVFSGA